MTPSQDLARTIRQAKARGMKEAEECSGWPDYGLDPNPYPKHTYHRESYKRGWNRVARQMGGMRLEEKW